MRAVDWIAIGCAGVGVYFLVTAKQPADGAVVPTEQVITDVVMRASKGALLVGAALGLEAGVRLLAR